MFLFVVVVVVDIGVGRNACAHTKKKGIRTDLSLTLNRCCLSLSVVCCAVLSHVSI